MKFCWECGRDCCNIICNTSGYLARKERKARGKSRNEVALEKMKERKMRREGTQSTRNKEKEDCKII